GDDLVHHLAHARPREAVDRSVEVNVLAPGEVRMESRTELEQRADAAADRDAAGGRLDDPGDEPQQRRLAGPVPPDEADRGARVRPQRDVAQSPDIARAGAP